MNPGASPATGAFVRRMVLSCNPNVRGAAGRSMAEMDLWHALEHLDVPTTVIAGEIDKLTPVALSRKLAEMLPNLQDFVTLPGIGHMSALEAPSEVNARIRALARGATDAAGERLPSAAKRPTSEPAASGAPPTAV
jgi:pimeloyl-ACP methyl ester carboxylesterase